MQNNQTVKFSSMDMGKSVLGRVGNTHGSSENISFWI